MQLSTLLKSIDEFCIDKIELVVIYDSTNNYFEEGYNILRAEKSNVKFLKVTKRISAKTSVFLKYWKNSYNYIKYKNLRIEENDFKDLVESEVTNSKSDFISFLTDDSIFIDYFSLPTAFITEVGKKKANLVYSFRHAFTEEQNIEIINKDEDLFKFDFSPIKNFRKKTDHWTYQFSVDGHVYNKDFLKKLIVNIYYINPNSFESFSNQYLMNRIRNRLNHLYFNKKIKLIGFELNKVQNFTNNHHHDFSVEELNNKYLEGFELTYIYSKKKCNDFRPSLLGIQMTKKNSQTIEINF